MAWIVLQNALGAAMLAGLAGLCCRCLPLSPALRHALWLIVILKLLAPPILAWPFRTRDLTRLLQTHLSIESEHQHLLPIINYIVENSRLPSVVDWSVVQPSSECIRQIENGPQPATPVTVGMIEHIRIDETPGSDVLRALLKPMGLTYRVDSNFVFTTSD